MGHPNPTKFDEVIAQFDKEPLTDVYATSKTFAKDLVKTRVFMLYTVLLILIILGIYFSQFDTHHAIFRQYGTICIIFGLAMAGWSLTSSETERNSRAFLLRMFAEVARKKFPHFTSDQQEIYSRRRVDRVHPLLWQAVRTEYGKHEIIIISIGTILAGFSDEFRNLIWG